MARHYISMDNFYNSFDFSKKLLEMKMYTIGTFLMDRKDSPLKVVETKLKSGEFNCSIQKGL